MRKVIKAGDNLPPWYGFAWRNVTSQTAVTYPVPFNIIFSITRDIWFFFKCGRYAVPVNPRAAYDEGYRQCLRDSNHAND